MTNPIHPNHEHNSRCNCGQVTPWGYDADCDEWYQCRCWRCLEIEWMKTGNPLIKSMLPWDTDMIDKFIELVIEKTTFLQKCTTVPFKEKRR